MKLNKVIQGTLGVTAMLVAASSAHASLSASTVFQGNGNWSLDGCGANSTPVCSIDAVVPTGSTIVSAFLYSSQYQLASATTVTPSVTFDGTTYSGSDWTALGSYHPQASLPTFTLGAYRADVTAQVSAAIGGGSASPFSFSVDSEQPNGNIDGEVLAIIYSNPAETERTIAFLDGYSTSGGDTTTLNLASPLSQAQLDDPSFEAALSLGIGFGFQGDGQASTVDVNGTNLTTCAGGQDDGGGFNGGLITVGGIGDDPTNNQDCTQTGPFQDDELYDLEPFLSAGDTSITIDTENPSLDDNIFFAGINLTAQATINPVPEPASLALLGLGLLGFGLKRGKKAA